MAEAAQPPGTKTSTAPDTIHLINVIIVREGETVSSRWGIHPQLKRDLAPGELQEVTEHMNRVVAIVGSKFAEQLSRHEGNAPGQGTA
jgi:hypothetical protein